MKTAKQLIEERLPVEEASVTDLIGKIHDATYKMETLLLKLRAQLEPKDQKKVDKLSNELRALQKSAKRLIGA